MSYDIATTLFHVVYDMDRHLWRRICNVVRCRYDIVTCRIRHGQAPLEAHMQCRTMSLRHCPMSYTTWADSNGGAYAMSYDVATTLFHVVYDMDRYPAHVVPDVVRRRSDVAKSLHQLAWPAVPSPCRTRCRTTSWRHR